MERLGYKPKRTKGLPPMDKMWTLEEAETRGPVKDIFPIITNENGEETEIAWKVTLASSYPNVVVEHWSEEAMTVDFNKSGFYRDAICVVAFAMGCTEHPIPIVAESAIEKWRQAGLNVDTLLCLFE